MTRYLLDTNVVSHLVRGNRSVDRHMIQTPFSSLCISAVSEGELLFGLASVPHAVGLWQTVREFLLRIEVLPWGREAAAHYGALRAELQRTGHIFGALEMLIAAQALATNAVLVTNDRVFRHVPGLTVEDWTQ